jgi:DTW domain-containing protein YfiP
LNRAAAQGVIAPRAPRASGRAVQNLQDTQTFRDLCLTCRRARTACWCGAVVQVHSRARVMLLQHPKEARNPMGTARMAHACLPGSALVPGLALQGDPKVTAWMAACGDAPTVVLYPSKTARNAEALRNHQGPINVVAIDGTWWQAQKLWKLNPWLHTLPAYGLTPSQPSRYRIRKEPSPECVSTVEALGLLLDIIEDAPGRHAGLLRPFDALVEQQLAFAASPTRTPRKRGTPRPRKVLPPVQALLDVRPDVVVVHGEGNGYSPRNDAGPGAKLTVWTACRLSTGERFEVVVDTGVPPSPNAPNFLGVDAATLAAARPLAEVASAFETFSRPQDVWVCFGMYSVKLWKDLGLPLPPRGVLDAQRLLRDRLKDSVGTLERAAQRLALQTSTPARLGRASRRVDLLRQVVEGLMQPHQVGPHKPR